MTMTKKQKKASEAHRASHAKHRAERRALWKKSVGKVVGIKIDNNSLLAKNLVFFPDSGKKRVVVRPLAGYTNRFSLIQKRKDGEYVAYGQMGSKVKFRWDGKEITIKERLPVSWPIPINHPYSDRYAYKDAYLSE